jgi:hypothetical protein
MAHRGWREISAAGACRYAGQPFTRAFMAAASSWVINSGSEFSNFHQRDLYIGVFGWGTSRHQTESRASAAVRV